MNTWAEINAKKYGEMAMSMIQAANLNVENFIREVWPPSFRIVHQPTQNYFAFGGEDGRAMWTRPGNPRGIAQTPKGRAESWDAKIRHFESWLGQLKVFLDAIAAQTKGQQSAPSPPMAPELDRSKELARFGIHGPDDVDLLLEEYADGYVWKFQSKSLQDIDQIRLEIVSARSFDSGKNAFRAAREFAIRWSGIRNLKAGDQTNGVRFFGFKDDQLDFGNTLGAGKLFWPSGDLSAKRRWFLGLRVIGLSREWLIELDLIWTQSTKDIELKTLSAEPQADGVRNSHRSVGGGPDPKNDEARNAGEHPRSAPSPDLLDRLSPDDPNYLVIKKGFLQSWADSHGLVAAAFEGLMSLTDYVAGCVRTFEQGAQVQLGIKDSISVTAKCDEIDVMMNESIRLLNDSLSRAVDRFGEEEIEAAKDEYFRRVNAVAFRAKQQFMNAALAEIGVERASEPTSAPVKSPASNPSEVSNADLGMFTDYIETGVIDPFQQDPRPLGENPFPEEHEAHAAFEQATWEAKEAIGQFLLDYVKPYKTSGEVLQAIFQYRTGYFNIVAKHATCVIGNERTAEWFEEWIDEFAKFFLKVSLIQVNKKDPRADPAAAAFYNPGDLANFEATITFELMRIVAFYKKVAASRVLEIANIAKAAVPSAKAKAVSQVEVSMSNPHAGSDPPAPTPPAEGERHPVESRTGSLRPQKSMRKGDVALLKKADGSYYETVDFSTAEIYAGISERRRQQLMPDVLKVVGQGLNRRIAVESLLAYCPPKQDPK